MFDSGEAGGLLYYVMPFVEGESLRAKLEREKQLPVDEAIRVAVAIASALDYAHSHGVIHRDLKPENILMQAGQPVVADFGIALAVSKAGGNRITQTGLSLGTPQYMSPEQATGDRVIDGRSDIYSLAAMTYEMLTGEPPHSGSTSQAVIARVLTENAAQRALHAAVGAGVRRVGARARARKASRRPVGVGTRVSPQRRCRDTACAPGAGATATGEAWDAAAQVERESAHDFGIHWYSPSVSWPSRRWPRRACLRGGRPRSPAARCASSSPLPTVSVRST